MTARKRLQLPSHTSQADQPTTNQNAEQALDRSIAKQQHPGVLGGLLSDAKVRQMRREQDDIESAQAAELAVVQVKVAAEHRKLQLNLDCERRLTEIRHQHNQRSGDLARQQTQLTSAAMIAQIALHEEIAAEVAGSNCRDEDKATLVQLSKLIAQQRIDKKGNAASRTDLRPK